MVLKNREEKDVREEHGPKLYGVLCINKNNNSKKNH